MVGATEEPQLEIYQVAESVHHHNQIIPEKKHIIQTTDYVYVYLCVCLCINLHVCACTCLMCLCVYVCVHVCVLYVCLCTCVCLHGFMCVCTCMCLLITENIILNTSITYAVSSQYYFWCHKKESGVKMGKQNYNGSNVLLEL